MKNKLAVQTCQQYIKVMQILRSYGNVQCAYQLCATYLQQCQAISSELLNQSHQFAQMLAMRVVSLVKLLCQSGTIILSFCIIYSSRDVTCDVNYCAWTVKLRYGQNKCSWCLASFRLDEVSILLPDESSRKQFFDPHFWFLLMFSNYILSTSQLVSSTVIWRRRILRHP